MATKITYTDKVKSVNLPNPANEIFRAVDANELKTVVNSHADDIDNVEASITTIDGDLTTAEVNIATNASNISSNTTAIATKADATTVTAIDGRLTTAEGSITTNASDISTIEAEQITQNSAIALNTAKVGITAEQATILSNTSGVNTGDQDISGIATNAANIATNTSDINTLDGRVTTNESNIANKANTADVVLKADYSPSHSLLVQQSSTGSPSVVTVGNDTLIGRKNSAGSQIEDLNATEAKEILLLNNVDNTSDLNKPISAATQSALDLKATEADLTIAEGNIATNAANIATNTSNIATNSSNIATNTTNISNKIDKNIGATYTTNALTAVTQAEYDALTPDANTIYFIV